MKNTIKSGNFRVLVYRGKEGYIGVCYETGFVDVGETISEVLEHISNGSIALLKTVKSGQLNEKALNQKPSLKYRIFFFVLPTVSAFAKWLEISFFTKPINPSLFSNS